MLSWVDGQPLASLPLSDRGLAYGDGLFETIQVRDGQPRLLERHLQRLGEGCARLRLDCDQVLLRQELTAFCAALGQGVAKLLLTRGDGLRGYAPPTQSAARRIFLGSALPEYPAHNAEQGVQLFPCQTRLAEQPLLAGLKHLNRLEQVLARSEWQDPQYAEGLVLDQAGRVIEGVFSNLFLVSGGVLKTPSLERCGVAGVMRAELLAAASRMGLVPQVRDVTLDELYRADEVFLCNSLYGVWPVRRLQQRDWPVGPLTRKLQAIASGLVDG
jgi:4-amino-4-deoxychorismate lyase